MDYKKQQRIDAENINTIGVVMFGLLGDVFIRTPVLQALKQLYPNAKVFACVDSIGAVVLENNPYCDELIIVNRSKKKRVQYYINKATTLFKIRAQKPDLMIDLYNGGSSPMSVFLSSAKYRLGYAHQKDKHLYNLLSEYKPYVDGTIDSYNVQILSILDVITEQKFSLQPIYKIKKESEVAVEKYCKENRIDFQNMYVINLGSGGEEKLLPLEIYAKLVRDIFDEYGLSPLIVKNPSQEYLQEGLIELLKQTDTPYIALELLSLDAIAVVLRKALFFITPDTGLMHLAFAFDCRVLTPFTYTNPKLVDIGSRKFFPVYDSFDDSEIHKPQTITLEMIKKELDKLIHSMQG